LADLGHEDIRHPETTYEARDLGVRGVLSFLVGLALVCVIVSVVILGMFKYLDHFQAKRQPRPNPLETAHTETRAHAEQAVQQFPQPRLQPDPVADLNRFRAREDQILDSYGWSDQSAGIAHIPIERAIDMIAQRGLPTRETNAAGAGLASAGAETGRKR